MHKRIFPNEGEILTDAEKFMISGPVKAVMDVTYLAHLNSGQTIQGKIMDGSNRDTNFITCFNRNGARTSEVTYSAGSERGEFYNDRGLSFESYDKYKSGHSSRRFHKYNEAGNLIETLVYDEKGKLERRHTYTHTDTGQSLENYDYQGENEQWYSKTVYEYEDQIREINGRPTRNMLAYGRYKADGSVEYKHTKTYNEQGLVVEEVSKYYEERMAGSNSRSVHKYNDRGDSIELIRYKEDGSVDSAYTFTPEYDADGKKIQHERPRIFDPYPLEAGETEALEHDHHGNWTKRTISKKGKPMSISVREFAYYDEPSENQPDFVHPLATAEEEEVEDLFTFKQEPLKPKEAKWLAEGTGDPEKFPLHRYYSLRYNEFPSVLDYTYDSIEVIALLEMLKKQHTVHTVFSTSSMHYNQRYTSYVLDFPQYNGYMLSVTNISQHDGEDYEVPSTIESLLEDCGDTLYFGDVQLLHPSADSVNADEYFEYTIQHSIEACELDRVPEKPYIYIVETVSNGFVMKSHGVSDDFEIRDLDVNYGYGFRQFHDDLMHRFNTSTKGLVLFHGEPGTGKTYYIRHLLRKMVSHRKIVIYMPPNMVDHLIDPMFMTFLAREVRNWSAQGFFCVLLIEDAEPLLAKRREGIRIQGVTNLLNLSDGLLNDMLNLQIICTFNVDLKKLDSALLRPGRLIARKEFKKLEELDANLLAQRLGIRHHFTEPASLGEIYSMLKDQNTLIHDVAPERDASTAIDDL